MQAELSLEPIVRALIERQAMLKINGETFAKLIQVTPSFWSYVKAGKRRPGRQMIDGALMAFPDLAYLYVRELRISKRDVA